MTVCYTPQANDIIEAIDAVTGDLKWQHRRDLPDDLYDHVGANAAINRNIAIYDRFIINTSDDVYVFGLDAETGELAWETPIFDYTEISALHSSGPIIADGKVISGRSCGRPEACVIVAHDARTGEELWRRRTIPAPGEPGDETWGGVPFEERRHVGTWMPPSYDHELRLIYQGTSVTAPAPKFMLGGVDNRHLYHNSTLALDVDTGEIRWHYQHLNDHWDLDHPFERILVDTAVAPDASEVSWVNPRIRPGEVRKVVTGIPGKTGVVYTLDRETGEFLWATPTVTQNVISDIDGATGAVTENAEVVFTAEGQEVFVCPTWHGGKDWEAGAYSPRTNMMYMPLRNTCARMMATRTFPEDTPVGRNEARSPFYAIAYRHQLTPGTDFAGTVRAISAETGETVWLHEQRAGTMSLVATGGGLVFGGDVNGRFRAFDDETGEVLWEINLAFAANASRRRTRSPDANDISDHGSHPEHRRNELTVWLPGPQHRAGERRDHRAARADHLDEMLVEPERLEPPSRKTQSARGHTATAAPACQASNGRRPEPTAPEPSAGRAPTRLTRPGRTPKQGRPAQPAQRFGCVTLASRTRPSTRSAG